MLQADNRPVFDFFGVTSPTPFTSVTLSAPVGVPIYDNATVGTAAIPSSVPEPATLALTAAA